MEYRMLFKLREYPQVLWVFFLLVWTFKSIAFSIPIDRALDQSLIFSLYCFHSLIVGFTVSTIFLPSSVSYALLNKSSLNNSNLLLEDTLIY